jgi:hypothetical protein
METGKPQAKIRLKVKFCEESLQNEYFDANICQCGKMLSEYSLQSKLCIRFASNRIFVCNFVRIF